MDLTNKLSRYWNRCVGFYEHSLFVFAQRLACSLSFCHSLALRSQQRKTIKYHIWDNTSKIVYQNSTFSFCHTRNNHQYYRQVKNLWKLKPVISMAISELFLHCKQRIIFCHFRLTIEYETETKKETAIKRINLFFGFLSFSKIVLVEQRNCWMNTKKKIMEKKLK